MNTKQNSTYKVEKFKFKISSRQLLTDPDLGVKEIVLQQLSCLFSLNLFHQVDVNSVKTSFDISVITS